MLDPVNLSITKIVSANYVEVGDQLVYTLTYQNTSTDTMANGVVLTDTLDPNVTFVTASLTPTDGLPDAPYWSIGNITKSTTGTIVLTVTVTGPLTNGTVLTNTATIDSDQTGPTSDDATTIVNAPTLELIKRDYIDPVPTGAPLTYTLTYSNAGDADATNVVITDVLDSNVTYVNASQAPDGGLPDAPYWNIGTLTPPAPGEIVITVTVDSVLDEGTILTNTATIASDQTTPFSQTITTTVIAHGDLVTVALTPAADTIAAGQSITYTLTAYDAFGNNWDVTASGTYTITPGAGGSWTDNTYNSAIVGAWTITGTYQGEEGTAALTVDPGDLGYFTFDTIASSQTAGSAFGITITAYDAYDNLKTDYNGTAALSDSTGSIDPTTATGFSNGVWSQDVTITRTGSSVVITATDGAVSDSSNPFNVGPNDLDHFVFDAIGTPQIAGTAFPITITAYDAYDNPKTDYSGPADLSDSTGTLDTTTTGSFSNAEWTGSVAITRTGSSVVITATDGLTVGVSNPFTVTPATLAYFTFDSIGDQIAGAPFDVTITAYDAYDNPKTDYSGPADLSDSTGTLDTTTTGSFSDAEWTGSVAITRTGSSVVITATDGAVSDSSNPFNIGPNDLDHFVFDAITTPQTAGNSFGITITAYDAYDNLKTDYNGTADLSDSTGTVDPTATGSFSGEEWTGSVTITRTGSAIVITATDGSVSDPSNAFIINPAALDHIVLSPQTATIFAWETQPYATEAFDVYENSIDDVTDLTTFSIVQSGHGGSWTGGNVYNPGNPGNWTVRAAYLSTQDTVSLTVQAPVLNIVKAAAPDPVEAGDNLTYTITYSNTGNYTATIVIVTDELDPNVSYVGASLPPDGGLPDAPFWAVSDLAPDERRQMTLTVSVARPLTNGTVLTNVAWIDADHVSATPFTRTTTVHSQPILTINKMDYPDPVNAGGILRYTFVVTNSGNENATSVVITEYYDPNASFFSANPPPDVGDNVWTLPVLPVDNPESIDIFVLVDNVLPVGTVLTNETTLVSDQTTTITTTETTSVTSVSELTVYKLDSPGDGVPAGEELIYIITYQTSGSAPAEDVVITETYDDHVTFVSANPNPETGTDNVWNIGDLPVDTTGNILVTMRVDTPLTDGTVLTNRVTIDSALTSPQTYTETTTVSSTPNLTLDITESSDPVQAGDPLTYTLQYRNDGNADATQVVVTATLDANVSLDTASPAPDGGADDVWYWEINKIAGEGGEGEIVVRTIVTAPLPNGTVIDLTAQLDDAEGDWLENTIQTTVASTPILRLRKSGNAPTVDAGGLLTYTLTYSNTGNEIAHDVVITDILDANTVYDTATPSPTVRIGDNLVYWDIGTLTPTVSGQITLRAHVNSPLPNSSILTNTAWIDSDQTAPSLTVENTIIQSAPILHIVKSDDPEPVDAGAILTYTLFYSNTGNEIAHNVVITDLLDANVSYLSASPVPNGGTGQGTPYWNIGDVVPAIPGQIILRVLVDSPLPNNTVLTNIITIDSNQTAPQSVQEDTLVQSAPILSLGKDDSPDPVQAGNALIYTINCSNVGNEIAHGVAITDLLDANVSYLSASIPPDGGAGQNAPYWIIGDVSPSAPVQITLLVNVTLPLTNGTVLTNTVLVNSDQTGTAYVTETTTVESAPVLSLDKDDGVSVVSATETLTYTIIYGNSGNENAYGITITDTLPSYVEYIGCQIQSGDCQYVPSVVETGDVVINEVAWMGTAASYDDEWIELYNNSDADIDLTGWTLRAGDGTPNISLNGTILAHSYFLLERADDSTINDIPANQVYAGTGALDNNNETLILRNAEDTIIDTANNDGGDWPAGDNDTKATMERICPSILDSDDNWITNDDVTVNGRDASNEPISGTPKAPNSATGCDKVVFHIPTLVASSSGQANLIVRVDDRLPARAISVTNHIEMTAPSLAVPISATDVDSIGTRPDLTIAADHEPSLFSPGRVMTYHVTYGNAGQMDAENVVITTTLLTGTVYTGTSGWNSFDGHTYTYTVGSLAAGDTGHTISFTVEYTMSNPQQIGAEEFHTIFTIVEADNIGEDANLDNNAYDAYIGVPDLIVADFSVAPWPIEPDVPVTFTVVLKNQGTGEALNPDTNGGFWVDVFIAPIDSYPWTRYSEIEVFGSPWTIAPNTVSTITLPYSGFSEEELAAIPGFYVKVDNFQDNPYGLVPESNELNNLGTPIFLRPQSIYLPLVQHRYP